MSPKHRPEVEDGDGTSDPATSSDAGSTVATAYGERARLALLDIVEFGSMARDLVARGRESFDADLYLRLASEAIVSRLGEAVARLPDDLVEAHPTIPFREVKDMRNLVAHEYHRIDHALVWSALERGVPEFIAQVAELL